MDNPYADKKRTWYNQEPDKCKTEITQLCCPWCKQEVDATLAWGHYDTCGCGMWSTGYGNQWMYMRNENEEDKRQLVRERIKQLEKELEGLKRAYGET
jgi:hypothetical protein